MPKDTKEIENKKKIKYGWLAFLFVIIHFVFILISIFPKSFTTPNLHFISNQYVQPFFVQRWAMFAPCPTFENRIKLKFYFQNDSSNWIDPSEELLNIHQKFRLTHHGNLAVGQYNMLFWLKCDLDTLPIPINQTVDFQTYPVLKKKRGPYLLKNYVNGLAKTKFNKKPISTSIQIDYNHVYNPNESKQYLFINFK